MTRDRKIVYSVSALIFAALLSCLFIPGEASSKITAACVLAPACFATVYFIKKRATPSINKRTVLLILAVSALLYVVLLYLSGLKFGFLRSRELTAYTLFKIVLPTILIIVSTEIIRCVILAQRLKIATLLVYLSGICADVLIYSRLVGAQRFTEFMEVFALYLLPGVTANLFYNYIAKRYGFLPNTAFRLITAVYAHFLPVIPAVPDALLAFVKILLPLVLLVFIDVLFEKKKRFATKRKRKIRYAVYGTLLALMASLVMIISCQFKYGMLVIATESMTGEINKGDAVLYESADADDTFSVGDVIVFKRSNAKIVHRIIEVEKINGTTRYYTKGDANESADYGYVTRGEIVGKVKYRLVYLGYPTLWLRELFDKKGS